MDQQPNIVLISLDTVRADHLSVYGYPRRTTPFLEAFSEKATVFERAFTASNWTLPSHMTMMTGLYPSYHGVGSDETNLVRLSNPWIVTMAEFLRGMGYRTVGITNSGFLSQASNFDRGFQDFWFIEDYFQEHNPFLDWVIFGKYPGRFVNQLAYDKLRWRTDKGAARSMRAIGHWLRHRRKSNQPSFVFIHLFDAHAPFWPTKDWRSRYRPVKDEDRLVAEKHKTPWPHLANPDATSPEELELLVDLYDAGLNYIDHRVEQIIGLLDRYLGSDNALVMITGDHGEALGERRSIGHGGDNLLNAVTHVPLIVRYPGVFAPGERARVPVSLTDLYPTVTAALNIQDERLQKQIHGVRLQDWSQQGDRVVITESLVPPYSHLVPLVKDRDLTEFRCILRTAVWGKWKYTSGSITGPELIDLDADPGEQNNLIEQEQQVAEILEARLSQWAQEVQPMLPPRPEIALDYSDEIRRRLQDLGYIE